MQHEHRLWAAFPVVLPQLHVSEKCKQMVYSLSFWNWNSLSIWECHACVDCNRYTDTYTHTDRKQSWKKKCVHMDYYVKLHFSPVFTVQHTRLMCFFSSLHKKSVAGFLLEFFSAALPLSRKKKKHFPGWKICKFTRWQSQHIHTCHACFV